MRNKWYWVRGADWKQRSMLLSAVRFWPGVLGLQCYPTLGGFVHSRLELILPYFWLIDCLYWKELYVVSGRVRVLNSVAGVYSLARTWGRLLDTRGPGDARLAAEVDLESSPNVDPS